MKKLLTALAIAAVPMAAGPAAASPAAHTAATKCGFHGLEQEHLGPSYLTSLTVSGVSCSTGKKLVRAYYRCRIHEGGVHGHCKRTVMGFHCSEHRTGISIQFNARVKCTRGRAQVIHTYTQDT
jgi:hypothetical protein